MGRSMTKMGDHSIHMEWQSKRGKGLFKHVRKGRLKLGELSKLNDGSIVYWAERKAQELVWCKEGWSFEKSLLVLLRCVGCKTIGVVTEKGDRWTVSYDLFEASKENLDVKFGPGKWMLPLEHWEHTPGTPDDIEKMLKVGKWK